MANDHIPRPDARFHACQNNFVTYVNGHLADWGLAPGNRLLVLTGELGSAKSTLMRYLLTGIIEAPVALSWFSTRLRGVAELRCGVK